MAAVEPTSMPSPGASSPAKSTQTRSPSPKEATSVTVEVLIVLRACVASGTACSSSRSSLDARMASAASSNVVVGETATASTPVSRAKAAPAML